RRLLPIVRSASPLRRLARLVTREAYRRQGLSEGGPLTEAQALWHLQLFAEVEFRALRASAAAVHCPVLVVYAEDDRLVAPAIGEELSQVLPRARRMVLPDGGHRLPQK